MSKTDDMISEKIKNAIGQLVSVITHNITINKEMPALVLRDKDNGYFLRLENGELVIKDQNKKIGIVLKNGEVYLRGLGGQSAVDMYTKQNSGVPNIKGEIQVDRNLNNDYVTGPFYLGGYIASDRSANVSSNRVVGFDASIVSSIYQNGLSEVRPTNHAVNFFIKY